MGAGVKQADILIVNARVQTLDGEGTRGNSIAIGGNEIIFIGDAAAAQALAHKATRRIDAQGASALPGFIESHMHIFSGAAELDQLHLTGVKGFAALAEKANAYAAARPELKLIVAQGADYTILSKEERLTRHHLDRIVPDRPFMMFSPDHHTAWANSAALERAGILAGRDVGVGSEIVMGEDGLATGELREGGAIDPVRALGGAGRERLGLETGGEPEVAPSPEERQADREIIRRGLAHCARHGITSFHNMDGNFYQLELLDEIDRESGLPVRACIPFHMKNFMKLSALEKASEMHRRYRSERLSSGFVKLFMDGVIDSGTAVMAEGYADPEVKNGDPLFSAEHFNEIAIEADRRQLQIAVHAIGDGAVARVLDGYEAAANANGRRDSRHRVEHIEVILPQDIERFARLGVVASMQPPHPPGTMGLPLEPTIGLIGERRWAYSYAWQTLREAGVRLAFGSDWPVSDINPLRGIHAAVTRRAWKKGLPEQRQSLSQTLLGYTADGAWTEFKEDRKGRLKPGMLADIVVLSDDIESVNRQEIDKLQPVVTICDGRITFEG
ncbi:amidohydrolase [Taklimakanibacter deserti]|uniref:amidohydrolase n=1 Tax=Taklimakanibacter deserti TaxID=2267839 RepID=UPI0013C4452A